VRLCDERAAAELPRIDMGALTLASGLIDRHTHLLARLDGKPISFGADLSSRVSRPFSSGGPEMPPRMQRH
jgi:hypothetical protein